MASAELSAPKLFARDITAYNDAELDRYLAENGRLVDVEDPENLPDSFIQRLRDRAGPLTGTAESHPIDLDQVTARLQAHARRSPSRERTASLDPEEDYREDVGRQTRYYNTLVADGGRPSHPLTRLEDIVDDPAEYREILSFWQGIYPKEHEWAVYDRQLWRWKHFRSLQRYARGQRGYDYWRSLWEDQRDMWALYAPWDLEYASSETGWQNEWRLAQTHYDGYVRLNSMYFPWRRFVKPNGQPVGQQGFPEYVEALKERLASHGFERPFQLNEDASQQDQLTTWIEYLGYEYFWYDHHAAIMRRLQKRHDIRWRKLVESGVLRPGELEESLCNFDAIVRRSNEKDNAEKAMESAQRAVSLAEKPMRKWRQYKRSLQNLLQPLLAARSKLETAEAEYASLKRRNDCISEFIRPTRGLQDCEEGC